MRVARVYHAGRDPAHRLRDQELVAAGIDLTLVVPSSWPGPGSGQVPTEEGMRVITLPVRRPGDVNRHTLIDPDELKRLQARHAFDLVDLHEEPFSAVVHQLLAVLSGAVPVVCYTAQNLDKRFPPPFAQWERQAFRQLWGIYACSRQAAAVVAGKGFRGDVTVLPLGVDPGRFQAGEQSLDASVLTLGLVGRMVPEKGVCDAVEVLAGVHRLRPARLLLVGAGPEIEPALQLALTLGVADRVEHIPWTDAAGLASAYQRMHWVLVPSAASSTWVEQFGRVVIEGQACGAVVASYASGSLPEVIADTGLLVNEGDATGLANGLVAASSDGRWHQWRAAGLDRAHDYAWTGVAAGQVDFYKRVIAAGPPSPPVRGARKDAVRRWGEPALGRGSPRPFALPVLRNNGPLSRTLERLIDTCVRP